MTQLPNNQNPNSPEWNEDDDEINLLDLLMVLLKNKRLIIGMVFFAGIAAVIISLFISNIYSSSATITTREDEKSSSSALGLLSGMGSIVSDQLGLGGGGTLQRLEVTLKSRSLAAKVIEKNNLIPLFFPEEYDQENKKWLDEDDKPTIQDGFEELNDILSVKTDDKMGIIEIKVEHEDPLTAKNIVDYIISEISDMLRSEVLRETSEKMTFFKAQLSETPDPMLKEKIYNLLAAEIEKNTLARGMKHYGFVLIDSPVVSDLDKKDSPKRALICILSVIVAFFIAIFVAFIREFISRVKTEDPERYNKLINELKRLNPKKIK